MESKTISQAIFKSLDNITQDKKYTCNDCKQFINNNYCKLYKIRTTENNYCNIVKPLK